MDLNSTKGIQSINSSKNRKFSAEVTSLDSWSEAIDDEEVDLKGKFERETGTGQYQKKQTKTKTESQKHINDLKNRKSLSKQSVVLNPKTLKSINNEEHVRSLDSCPDHYSNDTVQNSTKQTLDQIPSTSSNRVSGWSMSSCESDQFTSLDYSSLPVPLNLSLPLPMNRESSSFQSDIMKTQGQSSKLKSKSYQGLSKNLSAEVGSFFAGDDDESDQPRSLPPDLNRSYLWTDDVDQKEKVKNKLMSVWNNVKYGWTLKTKTAFKCDSPIFLLGTCYHIRPSDEEVRPGERKKRPPNVEMFKQDFASQIWFTYRQDFPQIPGTKMASDCGWGCMLRSGQMMLARAFLTHFLGRDWNVFREQSREHDTYRRQVIRWFGDFPSENSPFSIHRLVEAGKSHGKQPGDWYGPSSVAFILRESMQKAIETQPLLENVVVYVAQDCTVYKKDIHEMCCARGRSTTKFGSSSDSTETVVDTQTEEEEWKRAAIILVPVRLGGEELNPVYIPCIKSLLAQDGCIGIIGGKPKTSLYFVGWQDDKVIYLDPHYCQDAIDTRERNFPIQTFHCLSPRKISLTKMDPSCTIGFYCKTRAEFNSFVKQTEEMISPPKQKLSYPMFVFNEGNSTDANIESDSFEKEDRLLRVKHYKMDQYGRIRSGTEDTEEFVVL